MAETPTTEAGIDLDRFEMSDGVAGYLRDNPISSDRFFVLMARKAALEAPNVRVSATPAKSD